MTNPTFTTRAINGHWHMIVSERGEETAYPAASETGAIVMVAMEKRRRGILKDGGVGTPTKSPAGRS